MIFSILYTGPVSFLHTHNDFVKFCGKSICALETSPGERYTAGNDFPRGVNIKNEGMFL